MDESQRKVYLEILQNIGALVGSAQLADALAQKQEELTSRIHGIMSKHQYWRDQAYEPELER